jgi:YD repeat-containing protein
MPHGPGCRAVCLLAVLLLLFGLSPPGLAQQIAYQYDALGRLILVSTPEGIAQYEYDAVGNILRIVTHKHADVSGPVAILGMSPSQGAPGTTVQLYGRGFGATPAENQVAFHGTTAPVTAATASALTVTVPAGATTGPVSVTAPQGSATSLDPFTVVQAFAVVPEQADVALRGVLGFQATLAGVPTTAVTWRVNGIAGGNATVGTISATGLYTAASAPPPIQPVPVTAVLTADPTQVATASVRITGQASGTEAAVPISVAVQSSASVPMASSPVSVALAPSGGPASSGPISVGIAPLSTPAASGPVSVTRGPAIGAVVPSAGVVGATGLPVTVTGANFQGATAIRFMRNGNADATLTAASLVPAGEGSSLAFTLTIGGSAALGPRVVQVITPQGTSSAFDIGTNLFTVTTP